MPLDPKNIPQIVALIISEGDVALDLFLKLAALMQLGPDETQNILKLVNDADSTDDATKARSDAWLKEHFPDE